MEKLGKDSRLNLALRAASEVAAVHGLSFERAIVLQDLSNVIVHLYPTPVVARVATTTGTVRQGDGWFAREVAVARHLAAAGAPIIPPSTVIEPGPHQNEGLVLSFWEFVEILDEPFDPFLAGRALRSCHEALIDFSGDLPILALITEGKRLLTQQIAESVFDWADAQMLVQVSEGWERRLDCLPMQPLHGDPHSGNVLNTSQGVLWTDWEDVFIGPIEWDLASLVATPYVFGTDLEKAAAAIRGYRQEIDNAVLDLCIEVRTFVALASNVAKSNLFSSLKYLKLSTLAWD